MRIERIRLSRIRVPLRYAYLSSRGIRRHYLKTVVQLITDTGLVGLGETDGSDTVFPRVCDIAASLLGEDPLSLCKVDCAVSATEHSSKPVEDRIAFGGVEMACWDIAGKHHDKPVCHLLGGHHRSQVEMVCELSAGPFPSNAKAETIDSFFEDTKNIDQVAEAAETEVRRAGYRALKLKSIGRDPDWDFRAMSALRESLGQEFHLRHDPNAAYAQDDALNLCRRMDALGLQWFEDPTSTMSGMRRVKAGVLTPVATNMCVIDFEQLEQAIGIDAVDVIGIDAFHWGGLSNARNAIAGCEANGLKVFFHCFFDLGITTAAMLQLAASVRELPHGMDTCLYLQDSDVVTGGAFEVSDGFLQLPAGVGFGVTLDEQAVASLTIELFGESL